LQVDERNLVSNTANYADHRSRRRRVWCDWQLRYRRWYKV